MSIELAISQKQIENRIFTIRGVPVMIDRDIAEMYQVEVKRLNEQVRRNIGRFPEAFRFQLNESEKDELVANCDRFETIKHSSNNPYAFTEQGVAMLSAVLRSETAIQVSIKIISAFVEMRKLIANHSGILQRMDRIECKQLTLDVQKANEQYGNFELKNFDKSHDRFLVIDQTEVYHLGASLKDLGKKWFAFSKMDTSSVENIVKEIGKLI